MPPLRTTLLLSLFLATASVMQAASPALSELASYEVGDPLAPQFAFEERLRAATPAERAATETELISLIAAPKTTIAAKRIFLHWLGWIGSEKSIPTLTEAAKNPDTAHAAISALATLNAPDSDDEPGTGARSKISSLITYPPSEATRIEAINASSIFFPPSQMHIVRLDGGASAPIHHPGAIPIYAKNLAEAIHPGARGWNAQALVSLDPVNPALLPFLTDSDPRLRSVIACGMSVSRNPDVIKILLTRFANIPPDTQSRMMRTLATAYTNPAALPLIERALASDNIDVQLAAITAAGSGGNQTTVAKLIPLLASEDKALSAAAFTALTQLPDYDGETNAAIRLTNVTQTIAPQILRILAIRQDRGSFASAMTAATSPDKTVRAAGYEAVALLVRAGDLPAILSLDPAPNRREWSKALFAAAALHSNPAEAAALLQKQLAAAKPADRPFLIAALTMVKSDNAKTALDGMLTSPDIDVRKETIRALSSARSETAFELLLARINAATDTSERLLAQRGAIDTIDQLTLPTADKIEAYRKLWKTADSQETKDALIAAVKRMRGSAAARFLKEITP